MTRKIISSFDKFSKEFPNLTKAKNNYPRITALMRYFRKGGVISLIKVNNRKWPLMVYPSTQKLKSELSELTELLNKYSGKKKVWQKRKKEAEMQDVVNYVLQFSNPLYWQHTFKQLIDSDYRKDVSAVKLPVHLVAEKRWQPMIKMFVNDIEYRKQLAETVQNSVIYKKDKRLARYASQLKELRLSVSSRKSKSIDIDINDIKEDISMVKEIMKWSSER